MNKEKKQILIIGSGIAGLTAALDLARENRPSIIVEKEKQIGGHGARFNCKAVNGKCQKCGACLVDDALDRVLKTPGIEILTGTRVESIKKEGLDFVGSLKRRDKEISKPFGAVLFCHGFTPFDPRQKPNLKYGEIPNLITGLALEQMLRKRGEVIRPSDLVKPESIGFVQCVGSRDSALGNPYCSQVCCGYALRMARQIRSRAPEIKISFFFMDIQTFGKDFNSIWPVLKDDISFIREIPGDFYRAPEEKVGVTVEIKDRIEDKVFDMMVLSVGMTPSPDQETLMELGDLEIGPEGFLLPHQQPGIFVAGSATGPMNITDTIANAHASVNELLVYLENKK
ncbi:FAD-dependent oxidoreductase [Thermodesulfobacteriota bacterium]